MWFLLLFGIMILLGVCIVASVSIPLCGFCVVALIVVLFVCGCFVFMRMSCCGLIVLLSFLYFF